MRAHSDLISPYEALQALCRESLAAFTCKAFSIVEPGEEFQHNWHIDCIAEHLQAVYTGEIPKLIINMPPRSLKTLTTSVAFPAWGMGKDPSIRFMLTSFKSALAEQMTRRSRMLMRSEWYRDTFPETAISEDMDRQYHFETTRGGQYFSSSMSAATGSGCNIQILDDPLNPDEAISDQVRQTTIDTIRGTLFSRFNDPRKMRFILNMQRLHDADPTGDLLKSGGWVHLKLPAETKTYVVIRLGNKKWEMQPGDLLFPARFTPEVLAEKRVLLGDWNYTGQYLQEPKPLGGGVLKPAQVQHYRLGSVKPKEMNIVILVDPAGGDDEEKKKKDKPSDWTAMEVVGLAPDQNYYRLDAVRDRLGPSERIDTLFMLHRKWNELGGKPPKVGYEKYSMQSDIHYIKKKMQSDCYNFPLIQLGGPKSKTSRIMRLEPDINNNRWYFPDTLPYVDQDGRLNDLTKAILEEEMPTFPRAKYDDMLDALSRVYEPELHMAFPKLRGSMARRAIENRGADSGDSWENW